MKKFTRKPCKFIMLFKKSNQHQLEFYSLLEEQCIQQHPLNILGNKIYLGIFEEAFAKHYSEEGCPAKAIRLMLKHFRILSDESGVEQWMENKYFSSFRGKESYACGVPCQASELVHSDNRKGEQSIELIFKQSIRINCKDGMGYKATVGIAIRGKKILPVLSMLNCIKK